MAVDEDKAMEVLLTEDGQLSSACEAVLHCLYARFSTELPNGQGRRLHETELQEFSKACNAGKGFEEEDLEQIRTYFEYDETHGLSLNGFLDMYHTQTSADPLETWKDLEKLGYADSLLNPKKLEQVEKKHADTKKNEGLACSLCGKGGASSVCAKCKKARYCSRECQVKDWKAGHKAACGQTA